MKDKIFKVNSESSTNDFINRQIPTPRISEVPPVNFRRTDEAKPVQAPVVQDPIDIPPASSFDPFPPTPRSRIRDRFQGRVGTNRIEDFLINRQRRFQ